MKLPCEIVQDLLPLYEDGVCSEQTCRAVQAHLQECPVCREMAESAQLLPALDLAPERPAADRAVARGLKKIRRRWLLSLLALLLLLPTCLLGFNQYRGDGVSFTNLREIGLAQAFLHRLCQGDYEAAYQLWNIEGKKAEWLEEWFDEEALQNIRADGLAVFCESAQDLKQAGGIQSYRYHSISRQSDGYDLAYTVLIGGEAYETELSVSDRGIQSIHCDGSFLSDPLARFSLWSEWLWEQYEGCYFDPESGMYVYE